jgi:hypothetical protein
VLTKRRRIVAGAAELDAQLDGSMGESWALKFQEKSSEEESKERTSLMLPADNPYDGGVLLY